MSNIACADEQPRIANVVFAKFCSLIENIKIPEGHTAVNTPLRCCHFCIEPDDN